VRAGILPDLERELSVLKDFQRRTVDYVFRRFYQDEPPAHRFLVADEVGLGKTLVARGVIARALHHLHRKGIERIDVVYLCSNQDIAQQNLNRLNVTDRDEIALLTRLTLLPTQLENLESRHVNFVSLTPGTSLETTKSRQGRKKERVLLFQVLADEPEISWGGLRNLLQATVHRENWERYLEDDLPIDAGLEETFLRELRADRDLWDRLVETARDFRWRTNRHRVSDELNQRRYRVIGEIRRLMAGVCVEALEPDLIILDEFQRFRDLLDGDDEAARLTRQLLDYQEASGYRARVLLLSATPYRMLSLYDEEEEHYEDFLRTCRFLYDGSEAKVDALERDLRAYRQRLYRVRGAGAAGDEEGAMEGTRRSVEDRLRSVMVRTERAAGTGSRNAMLAERKIYGELVPSDLNQARTLDGIARAVEAQDPIEYWKSSPYLLNLMRGYQLKERVEAQREAPDPDLVEALRRAEGHLLKPGQLERYRELDPANGRLRVLLGDTLEGGQWKLLWMPPSLSYLEPGEPFTGTEATTKALVFSSWRVVPEVIAALGSYAAERRMLEGQTRGRSYSELHEAPSRPLEFSLREGRPGRMNPLMLMYPSPALAELGDPLHLAMDNGASPIDLEAAVLKVKMRIRRALEAAGIELTQEGPGISPDQGWYRAALAGLDGHRHPEMQGWVRRRSGWRSAAGDLGSGFGEHVDQFTAAFRSDGDLGFAPDDVPHVLAELALASPSVCAYRALRRISGIHDQTDRRLLSAAVRVADGFRTLFNRPETVGLLQRGNEDLRYWEGVLRYGLHGNLQAVLDEYAHVLRESLGLVDARPGRVVDEVAEAMRTSLSLGSGRVHVDEVRVRPEENRIEIDPFHVRSHYAIRFGHLRDERGETVARRGGVRQAFNSPFRPFILATTSIGQEGLDFHTYCHAVYHWNLPSNPVDLEQREGRVHRYKGHAIRKNLAEKLGLPGLNGAAYSKRPVAEDASWRDPWSTLFDLAEANRPKDTNDLVPYWIYDEGSTRVERRVPLLPFSREESRLARLKGSLAVYRMVFGQPRQEDLLAYLRDQSRGRPEEGLTRNRISLAPPEVEVDQKPAERTPARSPAKAERRERADWDRPELSAELVGALIRDVQTIAPDHQPRRKENYIGFEVDGTANYFAVLKPRSYGIRLDAKVRRDEPVITRLEEAGLTVYPFRPYEGSPGTYPVRVTPEHFAQNRDLIRDLLQAAYRTRERGSR
jgi:hypothetical protein